MKFREFIVAIVVALLLGGVIYLWFGGKAIDAKAPNVSMTLLDGEKIDLASLRGHPVLIDFWATSCPGCVAELPHLNALYKAMKGRGLRVIGVAMYYDPEEQVRAMQKARGIAYPIVLDTDGKIAKAFGDVQLTPTYFLISPGGRVIYQKLGAIDMQSLMAKLRPMLETH